MEQLSPEKRTTQLVVRYNCWVSLSAEDPELVQLLTQLLRVVNPEGTGPGSPAAGNGQPGPGGPDGDAAGRPAVPRAAVGGDPGQAAEPAMPVLSSSEARALIELVAARGISQGQLGTLLGLEKSTVSRLAAGLERKGWIKRGRDEANQRYIRLYLTPEGSRVAAMVWRAWQSRQARILSGLSGRERAGLAAGLGGLIRQLAAEGLLADVGPGWAEPAAPSAAGERAAAERAAAERSAGAGPAGHQPAAGQRAAGEGTAAERAAEDPDGRPADGR